MIKHFHRARKKNSNDLDSDSTSSSSEPTLVFTMKPKTTEEHINQVPYYLGKINSIQKKLDSTLNQTSTIEVKGTTAAFEWIKTSLANFLKTKDIEGVCSKLTVDKSGACISVSKKLKRKEKKFILSTFLIRHPLFW